MLIGMMIGVCWGVLAEEAFGSFQNAAYQAIGIVGLVYLFEIWRYCRAGAPSRVRFEGPSFVRRAIWALPSIAVLSALNLVPISTLEAAALDRRLRRLTKTVPLDRPAIEQITHTLKHSDTYKVKLPPRTITAVQSALEETVKLNPSVAEEAIKAGSLATSAATINLDLPKDIHGPIFDSLPEAKGSRWMFVAIAANTGPDNYQTIGMARQPDVARMEPIGHDFSITPQADYGPAFLVVKGLTATLDQFRLKHVVFQNMILTYNGGPLILEDVYFYQCEFQFRPSENSWKLMRLIQTGGWVRFSSA
jgi:hypothetical protein